MKLSKGKVSWPGAKQVFRRRDAAGRIVEDVLELAEAEPPAAPEGGSVEPLLVEVMREGHRVDAPKAWGPDAARERCLSELARLPDGLRRLQGYDAPPTRIGPALQALADEIRASHQDEPPTS